MHSIRAAFAARIIFADHFISVAEVADKKLKAVVRPDGSRRQGGSHGVSELRRNNFALRRISADLPRHPRDRVQYDETLAPGPSGDYTTPRPNYDHRFTPDDMGAEAGPVPELASDDLMDVFRGRPLKLAHGPQELRF